MTIPTGSSIYDITDKLIEMGTPADIPEEARRGFELIIDRADDLDALGMHDQADVRALLGDEGATQITAFHQYFFTTCFGDGVTE